MNIYTASEAKQHFGQLIDDARQSPVRIEKKGRPFVVVLSYEEFEVLEDAYWAIKAKEGKDSGYLGREKSEAILKELRKNASKKLRKNAKN